jgi:NADH/NAD ratio-sensing transcriptional regulator Rex
MRYHRIPDETLQRVPFYLRSVLQLSEQGVQNISSRHFTELYAEKLSFRVTARIRPLLEADSRHLEVL